MKSNTGSTSVESTQTYIIIILRTVELFPRSVLENGRCRLLLIFGRPVARVGLVPAPGGRAGPPVQPVVQTARVAHRQPRLVASPQARLCRPAVGAGRHPVDRTTRDCVGRAVGGVMGAPRNAELRRKLVAAGWGKTVP